jgi:sec-independent protein translocase protein TatB
MDSFFGIGMFELVMIAVIALVVLGPERLPNAMREVAKWLKQLRQVSNEFQSQFSDELKILDELNPRRILNEAMDPNTKPTQPPAPAASVTAAAAVRAATPETPAKPPAAEPVKVPIANAETTNSILPPPVAEPVKDPIANAETTNSTLPPPVLPVPKEAPAVSGGSVEPPVADDVAAQPTARDNDGAEAGQ